MSTPILATKLYIPPSRPNAVLRPRLLERLNAGLPGKLTLLSAPAGFGKTTLVGEWVAGLRQRLPPRPGFPPEGAGGGHSGLGVRIAWLSLDEGDNDPARFLTYLIAALQTIAAEIGTGVLAALQASQPPATVPESLLATLLNELAALPEQILLVLDDYHRIDCEPIDRALAFLLDHLPPNLHLGILTREDPRLPLARYRARGQLTELRAADLRFIPEEAAAFLNQSMNLNLSAADITALEARTEGWIAGLQLAALSLQGRQDIAGFLQAFTGSHRFVLDYLVEEVLRHQPEPVRGFLLQTSLLDEFCAPLCDAVTGRQDGKAMLEALERANLFLIPLDDRRHWHRYHHLFADVLRTHLMEAQPDSVAGLHGRASLWYEHNGQRSEAIRHALAAQDLERAAGLLELAWPAAEEGSLPISTWLAWAKALPDELLHARPVLTVWMAYAFFRFGEMEAAEARLTDAERWLAPADALPGQPEPPAGQMVVADREQFESLPAAIAVGRAYLAQAFGNVPDTVRYATRVLELVPEGETLRHGQAAMLLGMAYWASGDLHAAGQVFSEYTMKLRTAGNLPDAIDTTVVLADIWLALGRLHEAIRTIERLLQFILDQVGPRSPGTADLHCGLAKLVLEQGDLEAAALHLQTSKALGEKAGLPSWPYRWCITQARFRETQGDLDGALALLEEAERLYIRTPLPNLYPIPAGKARIWVRQAKLPQALEWVQEQGLSAEEDLSYLREFEHITLARILIAQYQNDRRDGAIHAALQLLDRLLQAAEEGGRMRSVIEILGLQALAHQAQGHLPAALAPLERALTLAQPEGYVRIFVDEGEPMRLLLSELARPRGVGRLRPADLALAAYLQRLLAAFSPAQPAPSPIANPKPKIQTLLEPLSERELDILRLLRTDLSGPEIARECSVSLSTVRTHTQNIYGKLGVNNRRAAVRRAEELDLF